MLRHLVSNVALWLISALAVPLAFSGCASAPLEKVPDANLQPVPLEELAGRLTDALCQGLDVCCQMAALGSAGTDCRDQTLANYQNQLTVTSQQAVRYDPRAAARCVAAFTQFLQGCSYEGKAESDAACEMMFVGTRAVGEACENDAECARPAGTEVYCVSDIGAQANTCQETLLAGQPCLLEGCAKDLFCDLDSLTCQPQIASGACLQFETCSEDSACSPDGSCQAKLASGEPCQLGLQCQTDVCGADGLCESSIANADTCQP